MPPELQVAVASYGCSNDSVCCTARCSKCLSNSPLTGSKNPFELTGREIEILSMLSKGMSYKMIGNASDITFHTVNSHLKKFTKSCMFIRQPKRCQKCFQQKIGLASTIEKNLILSHCVSNPFISDTTNSDKGSRASCFT